MQPFSTHKLSPQATSSPVTSGSSVSTGRAASPESTRRFSTFRNKVAVYPKDDSAELLKQEHRTYVRLQFMSRLSATFGGLIALTVIIGALLEVQTLLQLHPSLRPAQLEGGIALFLVSVFAGLLCSERGERLQPLLIPLGLALILWSLLSLFSGAQLETISAALPFPVAVLTGLLSICCLSMVIQRHSLQLFGQLSALVAGVISFLGVLGYGYDADALYNIPFYSYLSLQLDFGFLLVSLALLLAAPEVGIVSLFSTGSVSGVVVRRMFFLGTTLAISIGYFRVYSTRTGLLTSPYGTAIGVTIGLIVYTLMLMWTALAVDRIEQRRRAAERDLRAAIERQKMLLYELNHRVKNSMTMVHALARRLGAHSNSLAEFLDSFEGRVIAMCNAHSMLTSSEWHGTDLRQIIEMELSPHLTGNYGQITIQGEPLRIHPQKSILLHLMFHELATNSVKHGALGMPDCRVTISWERTDEPRTAVTLTWKETCSTTQPVQKQSSGFGRELLEKLVPLDLNGVSELRFEPEGLCYQLRFEHGIENDT